METSAGLIIYNKGKILLLKNNFGWDFPKGHVEPGEDTLMAAIREAKEETGIIPTQIYTQKAIKYPVWITIDYDTKEKLPKPRKKMIILYVAMSRSRSVKLSSEHLGYDWVDISQVPLKIKRGVL